MKHPFLQLLFPLGRRARNGARQMFFNSWQRPVFRFGLFLMAAGAVFFVTGCAGLPAWLAAGNAVIPLVIEGAGSVLTAIGVLTANPELAVAAAAIMTIGNDLLKALGDLQSAVTEYKANPTTTLLASIEEGVQAAIDHASALLGDFGLPSELSKPFIALAQLILTELENWAAVLPTLKLAMSPHSTKELREAISGLKAVPLTPDEFKVSFNQILAENPALKAQPLA